MTDKTKPLHPSLAHIRANLDPASLEKGKLKSKLESFYVRTPADDEFDEHLIEMLTAIQTGDCVEGYALMVTGFSGAGKSTLIRRRLSAHPAFKPYSDQYGNEVEICLRVRVPPACTMKSLGVAILRASGYPLVKMPSVEANIWNLVADRIRGKGYRIIYMDEFQGVLEAPTNKGFVHVTNTVRDLMQNEDWPLHLILAGVPTVLDVLKLDPQDQLDRRTRCMVIKDLSEASEADIGFATSTLESLTKRVGFKLAFDLKRNFVLRLMHGGVWRRGKFIQLIKLSIEAAIWDTKTSATKTVTIDHFAQGYKKLSKCDDRTNVMTATDWRSIERDVDEDGNLTPETRKKPRKNK